MIKKACAKLCDGVISFANTLVRRGGEPPLRHIAGHIRAGESEFGTADGSGAHAVKAEATPFVDQNSGPHPAVLPGAAFPRVPNQADAFLRGIYGDQYHTDGSTLARHYAHSLASAPEELHRIVATHMKERCHGGIWLGDSGVLELGHPEWTPATRGGDRPPGYSDRRTWKDATGTYDWLERALLLGRHSPITASADVALHELGHATDHALGWPSQGPAFAAVYDRVLPLIRQESPDAVDYYGPSDSNDLNELNEKKEELFAEGLAWFRSTEQPEGFVWFDSSEQPAFFNSVAAGHHMADYFRTLEKTLGIAA